MKSTSLFCVFTIVFTIYADQVIFRYLLYFIIFAQMDTTGVNKHQHDQVFVPWNNLFPFVWKHFILSIKITKMSAILADFFIEKLVPASRGQFCILNHFARKYLDAVPTYLPTYLIVDSGLLPMAIPFVPPLGIWCSTIPHLPWCFCPWTFFRNIWFNMVPSDPFKSHLATQLGYSAGEFQALQLIVLATFGVVD